MAEKNLLIQVETHDKYTLVMPVGDIDLSKSSELRGVFQQILTNTPPKIVVDLDAVSYMDSSGVATLIEALQLSKRADNEFALCCLSSGVRSIIELARLDLIFDIHQTREEAIGT